MTCVQLETDGDRTFKLLGDLVYQGRDEMFTVPAGFVTDFATVPPFLTWILPTYGRYTVAAIVHDYLCTELEEAYFSHKIPAVKSVDVDGIFRRIMREAGVPLPRRCLLWAGVRWGALFSRRGRRPGSLETLPLVLLVSILALPVVLVPTVFVIIGRLIDSIIE